MSTILKSNISSGIAVRIGILNQLTLRKITLALAFCAPLLGATKAEAAVISQTIPVTLQAEEFSSANGVKNETSTDSNGGLYTASINTGDWINYLNNKVIIPVTGDYIVSYRVASAYEGSSFTFVNINAGGSLSKVNKISVPKTGGVQEWTTIQRTVTMKAGPHYFGVRATSGSFSLNWIRIASAPQTGASSSSSSKAASSKSSVASSRAVSSSSIRSSSSSIKSSVASSSKVASSAPVAVSSSKASSSKLSSSLASSSKISSSAASSSKVSSSVASKSSSSAQSSTGYTDVAGPVGLTWIAPKLREDKSALDITELGGYQIRYKSIKDSKYIYITIKDAWTTTYNFSWLEGSYIFEIAAFDDAGVLSDFSNFTD